MAELVAALDIRVETKIRVKNIFVPNQVAEIENDRRTWGGVAGRNVV